MWTNWWPCILNWIIFKNFASVLCTSLLNIHLHGLSNWNDVIIKWNIFLLISVSDSENGFEEFFDFDDETGILNRLSQMFASCSEQTSEQVDIKIMFYELIRLICDFENQENRNGSLRQICKIDGFQQLSNKLFLHKMKSFRNETF